jgi:hypothetical protein
MGEELTTQSADMESQHIGQLSSGMTHQFRVGYALNPKKLRKPIKTEKIKQQQVSSSTAVRKWAGGGLADILAEPCLEDGLLFQAWDPEQLPENQPFFHLIIHKLTEDIDREDSRGKIAALEMYLRHYPSCRLVDPLDAVRKVISRARTCQHLGAIESRLGNQCPFRQPRYLTVSEFDSVSTVRQRLADANFRWPVICKPIEACGTPKSHEMAVLVREDDLHMLPKPCVVQQYEDHGGVFLKVYIIDDDVSIFRRSSLPDLTALSIQAIQCGTQLKSVIFDSRHSYPDERDFLPESLPVAASSSERRDWVGTSPTRSPGNITCLGNGTSSANDGLWKLQSSPRRSNCAREEDVTQNRQSIDSLFVEEPLEVDIQQQLILAARLIQEEFCLSLFGFDVLVLPQSFGGNRVVVVDVNYFPSYKEIGDFPQKLRAFLRRTAARACDNPKPIAR